ncbi:hypothetical protein ES705_41337 [subsurface metagenome]
MAGLFRTVNAVRDNSITTAKILANAVTIDKIAGSRLLSIPVLGPWPIDGDLAETNGGGLICGGEASDVTLTEAAAALAKVCDYGGGAPTYANLAASADLTGWAANYQLTADGASEEINDYVAFGHATLPFCEIALDIDTVLTPGGDCFVWEYSKGSGVWGTLTVIDRTDTVGGDGKQSFQQDGAIHFVPHSDWAKDTIDGQDAYWIRCRVTATNVTVAPTTNSKQHEIVTPTDGPRIPYACTLGRMRAIDGATTIHTTAEIKFFIMNFTKGVNSVELTFPMDRRNEVWADIDVECDANDVIGVVVTQEDTSNEVTNALLEIEAG